VPTLLFKITNFVELCASLPSGGIGNFRTVRRDLESLLGDSFYNNIRGTCKYFFLKKGRIFAIVKCGTEKKIIILKNLTNRAC
jgi:hypothetical protein